MPRAFPEDSRDNLRETWRARIEVADYERHMAAIGQAQANADLLGELFREHPPRPGASILFAGAGTGQCFDFLPPGVLAAYRATFSDINPAFLKRLAARAVGEIVVEDIQEPAAHGPFDLAIVVLVLEHVDWRRAAAGLAARAARIFAVIQENPITPVSVELTGSMAALAELAPESGPKIIDPADLTAEFARHRFEMTRQSVREVANGKQMRAIDFRHSIAGRTA